VGDGPNLDEANLGYVASISFELFKVMMNRGDEFDPHPVTGEDQELKFRRVALLLEPGSPVIVEVEFYSGLIERPLVIKLQDFVPGASPAFVADNLGDDIFAYLEGIYGVPLRAVDDGGRVVLDLPSGDSHPEGFRKG